MVHVGESPLPTPSETMHVVDADATQACWSGDGNQVLAGRRNGTVDIWDVRRSSSSSSSRAPNLLRTLKTPPESGFISCVVGFMDGRHIAT